MSPPRFSVVVPTYDRPERLAQCLSALAALTYPKDHFEVVVADDGSPVPAEETAARFHTELDLRLLRQVNGGPARARNAAARLARYEFLAFTDDDCAPCPQWLTAFAAAFEAHPDALLGGRTLNALPMDPYARASQGLVDYLYDYYGAAQGEAPFFTSNNMATPRDRFLALGGFDETFPLAAAEDREFGLRWKATLGPLRYVRGAVIAHAHAMTLRRFWRQHANYGRGARHLARVLSAGGEAGRARLEPPAFYVGLLAHPLTQKRSAWALADCALMMVSQAAMVCGYAEETLRRSA